MQQKKIQTTVILKIIVFVYLMVGLLILSSIQVKAYDKSKPFNAHDISTWHQGEGAFPENLTMTLGTSRDTIKQGGCGYYAIASMLVKCGYLNPKTQSPIDVVRKANEGHNTGQTDWHFDPNNISIFSSNLSFVEEVQMGSMSVKEGLAFLKKKYLEGYFLQVDLMSNPGSSVGHYIFVDGFKGEDMIITDSGYPGTKWSDYYGKADVTWKYVYIYKDKTKKCNELASVYSADAGKVTNSGTPSGSGVSKSPKRMIEILEEYSADIAKHEKEGIHWVYCNSGCKLSYPKVLATAKEGEMVNGKKVHRVKVNCAQIVDWALVDMEILEYGQKIWGNANNSVTYVKGAKESLEKWCEVNEYGTNGKTAKQLEDEGKLVPGDICTWGSADYGGPHTNVYAGNGTWYDAGRGGSAYTSNMYPDIPMKDRASNGQCAIFKSLGPHKTVNMNTRPTAVIHINEYEGLTEEEKAINDKLVREWELRGMSGLKSTYMDNQEPIEFLDTTSLSTKENRNVDRIKENREERFTSLLEKVRILVNVVGIFLMLYGILLAVAGMFDRINAFFDISLLEIFTLGRWRLLPEGMAYVDGSNIGKYLTMKGLFIRLSILELSGLVLISGLCYKILLWIIYWLSTVFETIF